MIPAGPLFHKPKSILAARNILYASLFLSVIGLLIRQFTSTEGHLNAPALLQTTALLVILFVAIYNIGFGRKWARTLFLVLFILGVASSLMFISVIFTTNLVLGFLFIIQLLLQIVALVYLYSKTSNDWFNSFRSDTGSEPVA